MCVLSEFAAEFQNWLAAHPNATAEEIAATRYTERLERELELRYEAVQYVRLSKESAEILRLLGHWYVDPCEFFSEVRYDWIELVEAHADYWLVKIAVDIEAMQHEETYVGEWD